MKNTRGYDKLFSLFDFHIHSQLRAAEAVGYKHLPSNYYY